MQMNTDILNMLNLISLWYSMWSAPTGFSSGAQVVSWTGNTKFSECVNESVGVFSCCCFFCVMFASPMTGSQQIQLKNLIHDRNATSNAPTHHLY